MHHVGSVLLVGLALASAACGKVQSFSDAAGGDDVVEIDATTTGEVTVTTRTRCCAGIPGAVVGGIDIVVVDADGAVRTALTDASGEATVTLTAGASVTAVYRDVTGGDLVTFVGVAPGDHLEFGEAFSAPATQTGTMTIRWPTQTAGGFSVATSCGQFSASNTASSVGVVQYSDCARNPFDALFIASDPDDTSQIGQWGLLDEAAWVNGGAAALAAWQAPTSFTLGATGLPAEVADARIEVRPVIDGNPGRGVFVSAAPAGGAVTTTLPWATGVDGISALAVFERPDFGPQATIEGLDAGATAWQLDAPITLPWLGEIVASPATLQAAWSSDGEGSHDVTLMFFNWSRTELDGGVLDFQWAFFLPPGAEELAFPELPGTLASFLPEPDDSLGASGGLIDIAADDGYDALRARPEWAILGVIADVPEGLVRVALSPFGARREAPDSLPLTWTAQPERRSR